MFRRAYFRPDAAIRLSELTPEDGKGLKARREFIVPNGIADPSVPRGATHGPGIEPCVDQTGHDANHGGGRVQRWPTHPANTAPPFTLRISPVI